MEILSQIEVEQLDRNAIACARNYLNSEKHLVQILNQIDQTKSFRVFGCTSTANYAIKRLKLSEPVAMNLISIARAGRKVPRLMKAVESSEIPITHAKLLSPVINSENADAWIEKAKSSSRRELEREIVSLNPDLKIKEKLKQVSETRAELKVGISTELESLLRKAQDIVSRKLKKSATLEEVLTLVITDFVEKKDPVKKAEKSLKKKSDLQSENKTGDIVLKTVKKIQISGKFEAKSRVKVAAKIRHEVMLRDGGRCTSISDGKRCESTRFIDLHHIIPVSEEGTNAVSNLTLLCSQCHKLHHEPMFVELERLGLLQRSQEFGKAA